MNPIASGSDVNTTPGVTSPLLDALPSEGGAKTSTQNTSDWLSKNIMSSSPGSNLISLGESPPTFPSSYEGRQAIHGWNTREQRGIPSPLPTSRSPPVNRPRPTSYHNLDGNFARPEESLSQVSYASRRRSMASPYSQFNSNPPLPHQIQPHFYGLPDVDFMQHARNKQNSIPTGYYCGFDERAGESVVIAGYEGGFDVCAVTKRGLNRTTRVTGLRGGVHAAKILNNTGKYNSSRSQLIAVVVHGPFQTLSDVSSDDYTTLNEGLSATQEESVRGSPRIQSPSALETDILVEYFQTTVEVYSLSSKEHVATLLSLPKTLLSQPTTSPHFKPPPPAALTIRADAGNIVVASGTSGETWLYRQENMNVTSTSYPKFKCIGKVWTAVQQGIVESTDLSAHVDGDWNSTDLPPVRQNAKTPIISLNGRWLAFCPSTPSSQISVRAVVHDVAPTARVPGLNGQAPPQLPPVNCEVETPGGESVMKQVAQVITQRVAEGATYIGKTGVQYWNSYWNKPSANQAPNGGIQYPMHTNAAQQFPPTHGVPSQVPATSKDPGLISIIDLDHLAQHSSFTGSPHPFATFKVSHGCSFISFAPNGLALFTASSKGDVQFVWDLMRTRYAKSSFLKGGNQTAGKNGAHVRQIAQFSRMTIARVVDVVWTSPHGERAAMVTERGTVHVLDLPASAFTWPPPRQKLSISKTEDEASSAAVSAAGVASSAITSVWTGVRPLVTRKRRSSTGISSISTTSVKSQAGHGTQALAAGISRSVGAATGRMNEMRKSGNTKLHLPNSTLTPSRACIRLLNGKRNDSVFVLGGGVVGLYTIKSRRADRPADNQKASKGAKYIEFRLPHFPDAALTPEVIRDIHQTGDFDLPKGEINMDRNKARQATNLATRSRGAESSIPQAEIESNAPYQPFHTDRRVALHVYAEDLEPIMSPSVSSLLSSEDKKLTPKTNLKRAWAFGEPIRTTKLDVGPLQNTEDSFYDPSDHRALPTSAIERVTRVTDSNEETEHIVVTTRIRKSARSGNENGRDEEGFFEDDCEVLDFASQRV